MSVIVKNIIRHAPKPVSRRRVPLHILPAIFALRSFGIGHVDFAQSKNTCQILVEAYYKMYVCYAIRYGGVPRNVATQAFA